MATTIKDRIYDYSARNRVPLTGAFELSPICNFSCRMCYVRKTPEEVKDQVKQRCEIFSKNGGYIFNTIHIIQANIPVKNIAAMIEAVKEFNGDK